MEVVSMKINPKLEEIYRKNTIEKSKLEQEFIKAYDSYSVFPMSSYFSLQDIEYLHKLAMSASLNCNVKEKYRLIGELMEQRGFKLIGGGTNRRAYECIYDNRIIAKVATDQVGFTSNLRELEAQNVLKPFCCKVFEVSPCGTLSIVEKVVPIKDTTEYEKYCDAIFDILFFRIRNSNIAMEDIGTRSFKNWGYRNGFGPVLLDYPTMYVADMSKRLCRKIINGRMCGGSLDYDEGFNVIVCSECGSTHFARTLAKKEGDSMSSLLQAVGYQQKKLKGEKVKMRFQIIDMETGIVESERSTGGSSKFIDPTLSKKINDERTAIINNQFIQQQQAPKKKKSIRLEIVDDVEAEAEIKARIEASNNNNNTTSFNPIIEEDKSNVSDSYSSPSKESNNSTADTHPHITDDKRQEIYDSYNKKLSELATDRFISHTSSLSTDSVGIDVIKQIRQSFSNLIYHRIDRYETNNIYQNLSSATLMPDNEINDNNIRLTDKTVINQIMRKINPNEDCFETFFMLVNTIANTMDLFEAIIAFWNTVIEHLSFDSETDDKESSYCVYNNIYDKYMNSITRALNDYYVNVKFNDYPSYNRNNILSIINTSLEEVLFLSNEEEFGYDNDKRFITITRSENHTECVSYYISGDEPTITNVEPDEIKPVTPIDLGPVIDSVNIAEIIPQINPNKHLSKKQRNKFNKKKGK